MKIEHIFIPALALVILFSAISIIGQLTPIPASQVAQVITVGKTYYVDGANPTASDSNLGTEMAPFKTIQKAANIVLAGDTVIVKSGTYEERVLFSSGHSGSPSGKITFIASPSKSVTMYGFNTTNASYLRIEGFNITATTTTPTWWLGGGVWVASNNVEVVGNYFYNLHGPAVLASWQQPWTSNAYVANNKIYHTGAGVFQEGDNWVVENNDIERLYHYSDSPDSDYFRFFGSNGVFRHNFAHGSLKTEIGASHTDCFQTFDNNGEYAQHYVFEGNICYDYYEGLMGSADFHHNSFDLTFRNNIFAHSWSWGLDLGGITDIKVYNNVFSEMTYHGIGVTHGSQAVVSNNIFYNAGSNYWADASSTVSGGTNIMNVKHYPNYVGPTDIITDPLLVDPTNNNFHLQSGSPAIDKGTSISVVTTDLDGTSRPQGSAYDIGAYEYTGTTVSPSPSPSPTPTTSPTPTPTPAPAGDTTAPTITITQPLNGETWTTGRLTITANATDNVGIAGVTFYINNQQLGSEITTSPYRINWRATVGTYTITAKARDTSNNTKLSAPVTVTIVQAVKGKR